MEPIKPIEGTLNNGHEQAIALSQIVRERYWQNRAHQAETVRTEAETGEVANKKPEEKVTKKEDKPRPANNGYQNTYAEFTVDQDSHEVIVRIFNADSGELVRTLPPEKLAEEIAQGKFRPQQIRRRNIRLLKIAQCKVCFYRCIEGLMSINLPVNLKAPALPSYTYPEFVIDERSGQVKVNLIDKVSGRVVRHIPPTELNKIVKGFSPVNKNSSH